MKKLEIVTTVTRGFNKVGFALKKHSPEIMVVTGVFGAVAGAVLACKATTKLQSILDESKEQVDAVHEVLEDKNISEEKYSEEDSKKDLAIIYVQTGLKIAKLYAPAVGIGVLSIASILTGHNILRKRNLALAAAYTVVDTGFKEYRGRVVERFGKELDNELKNNIKAVTVEETVVNEDGTETKVERVVHEANPNFGSTYARFFDCGCTGWDDDPEYSLMFLRRQQDYANDMLKQKGHLFLNEVYDMFNIPRTHAGQIVGWVYDKNGETGARGDNYVDFGIYDLNDEDKRCFVNGKEKVILLDFNVDGVIINRDDVWKKHLI